MLLAYSKKEEMDQITLFDANQTLMLPGEPFIKPFRMHQNGRVEVQIELSKVYPESKYQPYIHAYVTDLFSDTQTDVTYGPRYLVHYGIDNYHESTDLKIGDYVLILRSQSGSGINVHYVIQSQYPKYPHSKWTDWALAFIEAGISMLLVGVTLILS